MLQAPEAVVFESLAHDFGSQPKNVVDLTHEFVFTNTSGRDLRVTYAVATCSCTKLSWTNGPVKPGAQGVVKVRYVREMNVDSFEKFISVFFDGLPKPVVLRISGNFYETSAVLSDEFPVTRGPLRFKASPYDTGCTPQGQTARDSFWVANDSQDAVVVTFKDPSDSLSIWPSEQMISPLSRARFFYIINVDSEVWGRRLYSVTPVAGGTPQESISFAVTAIEDFSSLTEEQASAGPYPRLVGKRCSFGSVPAGQPAWGTFRIVNDSEEKLLIRAAFSDTEGIEIVAPESIEPHKTGQFTVSIAAAALVPGMNSHRLCVLCNSPQKQIVELYAEGTVE